MSAIIKVIAGAVAPELRADLRTAAVRSQHRATPRGFLNALRSAMEWRAQIEKALGNRSGAYAYITIGKRKLAGEELELMLTDLAAVKAGDGLPRLNGRVEAPIEWAERMLKELIG